ncbi:MAG: hypothetical protein ABI661_03560 [Gammaproteobacteria bacterium]
MHQGDLNGIKGLYHIKALDCVTHWQVVASVQAISDANLLSVIEEVLAQVPFEVPGFHADNGSEHVNHKVARLLDHDKPVAFSCQRCRFLSSCGARRMPQAAAHLVDQVIPHVPVRQWVRYCRCRSRCACCWPRSPSG